MIISRLTWVELSNIIRPFKVCNYLDYLIDLQVFLLCFIGFVFFVLLYV